MMRKVVTVLIATLLIFSLVACGNAGQNTKDTEKETSTSKEKEDQTSEKTASTDVKKSDGKTLIVYFSQSASMDTEQFDNSMDFVRENAKGASVHDGLFTEPTDTDGMMNYLKENEIIEK